MVYSTYRAYWRFGNPGILSVQSEFRHLSGVEHFVDGSG